MSERGRPVAGVGGIIFSPPAAPFPAAANDWLMQFQADVLGAPVRRPDVVQSAAMVGA